MKTKNTMVGYIAAVMIAVMALAVAPGAFAQEEKKDSSFIKVPVGLQYASTYWWRGIELNGKGVGVLWPSAGLILGDTGLSFLVAAGLNADYFAAGNKDDLKYASTFHEFDYGASYATEIGGMLAVNAGLTFIHYALYDRYDSSAVDPSFLELTAGVGVKVLLNPRLDILYDYYIEENAAKTPQGEDVYVRLSIAHELVKSGCMALALSAWLGYYNNAYLDRSGMSDLGLKAGISAEKSGVIYTAGVYYARSLAEDFQMGFDPDGDGSGRQKDHLWADFGASYTF
jgi:hypothetical protein